MTEPRSRRSASERSRSGRRSCFAPMSGVTNRTLRALYKPFGFGLTVTEFVSSNALQHGNKRTMEMIDQHGVEQPVSTQLWGNDPAIMA